MTGPKLTEGQKLFDKTGREIVPGDVLKVFHFVGARRKRYYMYKHALSYESFPKGHTLLRLSHLDMKGGIYCERADGRSLPGYEIVQGIGLVHFEDRPRRRAGIDAERASGGAGDE